MRIQLTFVLLMFLAATSTSVVWREFAPARGGDELARALVLALAPVGVVTLILAGRIVIKVQAARQSAGGR